MWVGLAAVGHAQPVESHESLRGEDRRDNRLETAQEGEHGKGLELNQSPWELHQSLKEK